MSLASGVNVSLPRSAAAITWPGTTATPSKVRLPAPGRLSMRTACRCWPASVSLKAKSAALKLWLLSSSRLALPSAPCGGVLPPTCTVRLLLALAPWLSLIS